MNFILVFGLLFSWVTFCNGWSLRESDPHPPDYEDQQTTPSGNVEEIEEDVDVETTSPSSTTAKDPFTLHEAAKQTAMHVIFEKMFIALGPDFPVQKRVKPSNESLPTVVTPLNITTDPCPEKYAKCSSENFLPSCSYPRNTNTLLWKRKFNLFFDLPPDLLETDTLLNATLRLYKNDILPLSEPSPITVELHRYVKSLTKKRDVHLEINSTMVMSDFIGWVSLDVTELIRNLRPKKNHGFLIKVKDAEGILWIEPRLFVPMDCSSNNISVLPLPFGVKTNQPEQKFPSLNINTGRPDVVYYPEIKYHSFGKMIINEKKGKRKEKNKNKIDEEPILNFYEFSRSSKRQYNDRDLGLGWRQLNHGYLNPDLHQPPLLNSRETPENNYKHSDPWSTPEHKWASSDRRYEMPGLPQVGHSTDKKMSNANDKEDYFQLNDQTAERKHFSSSPKSNNKYMDDSHTKPKMGSHQKHSSKTETDKAKKNKNTENSKMSTSDFNEEEEEEFMDDEEEIPYSSIEISIHSNGWNKPLWSIQDMFEPKRPRDTARRRRHKQHKKKRPARQVHHHHNSHKRHQKSLTSESKSKS